MTKLYIYNNNRRKTPLITMPFSKEAYIFYKQNHPGWILKLGIPQDTTSCVLCGFPIYKHNVCVSCFHKYPFEIVELDFKRS